MSAIRYRADIDGLRAVAVSAVLLFHAGASIAPGGFIGVDVFFVISGYLITSIISEELKQGTFSIWSFYERRIRRLAPALTLVIAASAAIGWFVLTPQDYMNFGRSVIAAAAFYSNFYFHSQSGYFEPAAETQPLLHTWSLGVEEQFYLIAPGFILLLTVPSIQKLRTTVFLTVLITSFAISVHGVAGEHESAFYLLPSRAFELMIGMALALGFVSPIRSASLRQLASVVGLAMIGFATVLYSEGTPFPGFAALVPCIGTALLIHSGYKEDTISSRLLATKPMVFVGKLSYALYLWHWPLLAYAAYEFGDELQFIHKAALLAVAFVLSVLTYYCVEQPVRGRVVFQTRLSAYAAGTTSLLCCLTFAVVAHVTRGLPERLSPEAAALARSLPGKYATQSRCLSGSPSDTCLIGDDGARNASFVLWGDSHARMLSKALAEEARQQNLAGFMVLGSGCAPLISPTDIPGVKKRCLSSSRRFLNLANAGSQFENIILASRWGMYLRRAPEEFETALRHTVDRLLQVGRTVTIIGPAPELPFHLPQVMIKSLMRGQERDFSISYAAFREQQSHTLRILAELDLLPRVRVLYPHLIFCNSGRCKSVEAGQPLYVDGNHLSPHGAKLLTSLLREALEPPIGLHNEVVGRIDYHVH